MSLLMFTFRSETEAAILTWKPDPVSPLCSFSSCFLLPVLPPLVFFLPSLLYLISVSAPSTKAASTNVLTPGKRKTEGETILIEYLSSQTSTLLRFPSYLVPRLSSFPLPLSSCHILCCCTTSPQSDISSSFFIPLPFHCISSYILPSFLPFMFLFFTVFF